MFAVLSATGNVNPTFNGSQDLAGQQKEAEANLVRLQHKRADLVTKKLPTAGVDSQIQDARDDVQLLQNLRQHGVTSAMLSKNSTIETDVPFLNEAFQKAKENPDLLLYKLKSNSYKWSWAIIPLSVPFVWLLFPFSRRFKIYDHVVFVTYSLCFMTFLVTAGVLLSAIGLSQVGGLIIFFAPPIHMYRQLRGTYGVGRWGAVWRTFMLMTFAVIVLTGFILLMAALGILD